MTTQELAELFGYNIRRIQQLTKEGMIVQESRNSYVLSDVVKNLVRLNLEQAETIRQQNDRIGILEKARPASENPENDFASLVSELCDKNFADYTKGDLEKMEKLVNIRDKNLRYEERQAVLCRIEDVELAAADMAGQLRNRLMQIPTKVCDAFAATIDADEIERILDTEIENVLKGVADVAKRL